MAVEREIHTVTRRLERWALPRLAARLPRWVTPDHLTALGILAALIGGSAYAASGDGLGWLHLASGAFVLHWFADSLDGTLARLRRIERPKYGLFVDHTADAFSAVVLLGGIAISGLAAPWAALLVLCGYLLHFSNAFLVALARGSLRLAPVGGVGPTELRLIAIGANTAIWATGNPSWPLAGGTWTLFDVLLIGAAGLLLSTWLVAVAIERSRLAKEDPTPLA